MMAHELVSFLSKVTNPERTADAIVGLFSKSTHSHEVSRQIAAAAFAIYEKSPLSNIMYLDMAVKYMSISFAGLRFLNAAHLVIYSMYRYHRYLQLQGLEDLDAAINVLSLCTSQTSASDQGHADCLSNLSAYFCIRYDRNRNPEDLEAAIVHCQTAIKITAEANPLRGPRLRNLVDYCIRKYKRTRDLKDLDFAIVRGEEALEATPQGKSEHIKLRYRLSLCWREKFDHSGILKDLEMAITHIERIPDGHPGLSSRLSSLASNYHEKFRRTKNEEDLEMAIAHTNAAAVATSEASERAHQLHNLASLIRKRYKRTGALKDLAIAIMHTEEALEAISESPDRVSQLCRVGSLLSMKYEQTKEYGDLDRATKFFERAVEAMSDGPGRAAALYGLSMCMHSKYEGTRDLQDLERAIAQAGAAVKATPLDHSHRAARLCSYAEYLSSRYQRTGDSKGVDAAISHAEAALATIGDKAKQLGPLSSLAMAMAAKYQRTGHLSNLEKGIILAKDSVEATPVGHRYRANVLANFATFLSLRYKRTSDLKDLETAIRHIEEAVAATHDRLKHAVLLDSLANCMAERYQRTGHLIHLEKAITLTEEAVKVTPVGHPERGAILCNLAGHLISRYEETSSQQDLGIALERAQEAIEATPEGHPYLAILLNTSAIITHAIYARTRSSQDLDMAILRARAALDATPDNHVERSYRLDILAGYFNARFERIGHIQDLDMAIAYSEDAMKAAPIEDSLGHSLQCRNLSNNLFYRYGHTGNLQDLETAIALIKDAMEASPWPDDHPKQAVLLTDIAVYLGTKFDRTEDLLDLEMAIAHSRAALKATRKGHVYRVYRLYRLSALMGRLYDHTMNPQDLESAIALGEETPKDSLATDVTGPLVILSQHLDRKYKQTGHLQFLQAAITCAEAAVDAAPDDHARQGLQLSILGGYHWTYAENSGTTLDSIQHYQCSISAYLASWNCKNSPLLVRLRAALAAGILLVEVPVGKDLSLAQSLLSDAVHLLPLVASRSLGREDQQYIVSQLLDLTSFAASASLAAGKPPLEALQLLELGRNLTNSQLLDYRMDISELADRYPELARTFDSLRMELDSPFESAVEILPMAEYHRTQKSSIKRRNEVARKFDATLEQIRREKGFENFLLPSTKEFFVSAAREGPVVVLNVTKYRSDAILVTQAGITSINLLQLSYESAKLYLSPSSKVASAQLPSEGNKKMKELLTWLWRVAVEPVLLELGILGKAGDSTSLPHDITRIWWIGTGLMASAPIHAAGIYKLGKSTKISTLDYCIPSYIPTIRSLMYSRTKCQSPYKEAQSILIVTMPTTPQESELAGVWKEAIEVARIAKTSYQVDTLPQPTAESVLQQLPAHAVVHFACHGRSTSNPANSHLLLLKSPANGVDEGEVDKLYAKDIAAKKLPISRLAYLSACCSADNAALKLADEVAHLASSFHVCGFSNVIGTLWQAEDKACTEMATEFYTLLMKCDDVALAYRDAVLKIREKKPGQPMYWAPFIHLGCDSSHQTHV